MDLESIVTLAALAGFAVTLFGYLATMKRDLRADLRREIAGFEARMTHAFDAKIDPLIAPRGPGE